MKAIGHMAFGAILGWVITLDPIYTAIVIAASLIPDIDHPYSTYGKYNPIACLMKHRGHCHSIVGVAFLSLPFIVFSINFFALVFIGCIGHIVADRISSTLPNRWKFSIKLW